MQSDDDRTITRELSNNILDWIYVLYNQSNWFGMERDCANCKDSKASSVYYHKIRDSVELPPYKAERTQSSPSSLSSDPFRRRTSIDVDHRVFMIFISFMALILVLGIVSIILCAVIVHQTDMSSIEQQVNRSSRSLSYLIRKETEERRRHENYQREKTLLYVREWFPDAVNKPQFLSLDIDQMKELVAHDQINCKSEVDIIHAIIKWVNADRAARSSHVCDLSYIRGYILDDPLFSSILKNINTNLTCNKTFKKTDTRQLRRPEGKEVLLVLGGYVGSSLSSVELYDSDKDQWEFRTPMPTTSQTSVGRYWFGTTVHDHVVHICGGHDSSKWLSDCLKYDPMKDEWSEMASMPSPRDYFSLVSVGDDIYAVGGGQGISKYSTGLNRWNHNYSTKESTKLPYDEGMAFSALNGVIWGVGGCCPSTQMHRYNPGEDSWRQMGSMRTPRMYLGLIPVSMDGKNYLYAIGSDRSDGVSTSERYNIATSKWTALPPMHRERTHLTASFFNGSICVSGGGKRINNVGQTFITSVECLKPRHDHSKDNGWLYTIRPMQVPRYHHGAVAVRIPITPRDYWA